MPTALPVSQGIGGSFITWTAMILVSVFVDTYGSSRVRLDVMSSSNRMLLTPLLHRLGDKYAPYSHSFYQGHHLEPTQVTNCLYMSTDD